MLREWGLTKSIFESALHNRVIDIGQNLQFLNIFPQTRKTQILLSLTTGHLVDRGVLEALDLGQLFGDGLYLLLAILLQNPPGLLKTLVG
jgi:hypothetical protein